MLKRFIKYYKPHMNLFLLDMGVAFIASAISIFFPFLTRRILSDYIPEGDLDKIFYALLGMLAIVIVKTICSYIRIKWGHILGVRMEYDMREDIFRHIQKLSFSYFDNVKTGHIMSRISNDLNLIAEVAHHAPEDLLLSIFLIIGACIFMFLYNVKLAVIAVIPLPIMFLWGISYGHKMRRGFKKVREKIADINSSVENSVQGIREVKAYTNENLEMEKFYFANFNFRRAKEKIYGLMAVFHSGMQFYTDFYYLAVIGAGSYLIYTKEIQAADLFAFILYINLILKPIERLVSFVEQLQNGAASFERFIEIMDIEPDIQDEDDASALRHCKGKINVENIWFKYSSSPDWILRDISFEIPAGKQIAIVGASGAGKSTIVSLIPRFYEVQKGKIFIDDNNIMEITQESLRENIGIVQQNVFLFDGTIRENIIYGNPNSDEDTLINSAKNANIYDFIMSLPEGFDTYVGERGVKLSGGQKQRISIARVFMKNPPILIFDEATSSLDNESEVLIQEAMDKLSKNRTTIIIAHRLSTVRNVDNIIVLDSGEIVEVGTHSELLDKEGQYYNLYSKNML